MMPQDFADEKLRLERAALLAALHEILTRRAATVATAESCTGGLLAAALTERPGSSAVFVGGIAAYANEAKTRLLGVAVELISRYGAVSREVAEALAQGAFQRLGTTYAVSTTGIAGPQGGSAEKPVGTVWIGLAGPSGVRAELYRLQGTRDEIRAATVQKALAALLAEVRGDEASEAF